MRIVPVVAPVGFAYFSHAPRFLPRRFGAPGAQDILSATWLVRLRSLPLRGKGLITVVGVVAAAVGTSTYFSFRYWQREIATAGEQQVLLAATSARATLESTLPLGRSGPARHALRQLLEGTPLTSARAYAADGTIIVSANPSEEGSRARGVWIPSPRELPTEGLVRVDPGGDLLRVYVPVAVPDPAVLELELSVAALRAGLEQGARLGVGLVVVSVLVLGITVLTMLEREVVGPLRRIEGVLSGSPAGEAGGGDEVHALEVSLRRLVAREREAEEEAAERERLLAEQEGLAEVGELAAEMAHEFKRPLASIRSAIDLLEQEYVLEGTGKDVLSAVNGQLERLTDTMQDLFSLARPVSLEPAVVHLDEVLDGALLEVARLPGGGRLEVRRRYGIEAPAVEGDARRLTQAFQNVLANAVEAMPEGGVLTVAVRELPDDLVEVSVTDTGGGIPQEQIERAVRPFYSTKPLGTGLGLPLVARIVASHRGRLVLESGLGQGTTVRIILPASPAAGEREGTRWHPNGSSLSTTTT